MNKLKLLMANNFKKIGVFALLSIGALTIQSCSKENAPVQEIAFLNITNTSPSLATFNIFVDQSIINQGAVPFGGTTGYLRIPAGAHNIKFTTAGNEPVITKSLSFENNSITSLFLIGKPANAEYFTVKDQLGSITSSKAFVRFINLSSDAPSLDLTEKDGDVIISNNAYKTASAFKEIDPKSYVLQFKITNTETEMERGTLETFEFKAGISYTVIAAGLVGATDTEQSFGGKIIINQ